MSRLFRVFLCCSLLFLLAGCDRQEAPMLLDVTGVTPRSLEAGDTVEISGEGFPEGKSASVTLEGALFRAGLANLESFRSTFAARVDSPQRLSFVVGAQLEEALSQVELSTAHATFRGRALVAFAPKLIGAPPVEGELKDLTLEIYSSSAGAVSSRNNADSASKLLTLLGIAVEQSGGQLHISGLQAGRAARAGVALGDTVLSANGVSVFSSADLLPGPQERQLTLLVKHADAAAPTRVQLSVDGLSAALPSGFSGVFAIALASMIWLFALSWKLPLWQASVASQLSKDRKQSSIAQWALFVGLALAGLELRPVLQGLRPFVVVIAVVLIALLRPLLGFLGVGFAGRAGFKFRLATAAAMKIQLIEVLALLSLAPLAVKGGGLGLNELRALQGAAPWHWSAFESLSGACAALLFLLTMLFDASGAQGSGALGNTLRSHRAQTTASFCDGLLVALKCALFATLFLGLGVPASSLPAAGRIASLLPVGIDTAKYALVVLLVTRLQSKLHFPRLEDLAWPIVGTSLFAAILTALLFGQGTWQQAPLMEWVDQGVAPGLCLAGAIGVVLALLGKSWSKAETPRSVAINPWL